MVSEPERKAQVSDALDQVKNEIRQRVRSLQDLPRPKNPLQYTGTMDWWEIFKMVLGIVVVPVKAVLITLLLAIASTFSLLATSFGWDDTKPMTGIRRLLIEPVRYLSRLVLMVYGFYWVKVKGKPVTPDVARIIVAAPHSTVVDALYLAYVYGLPSVISKAEVTKIPVVGPIFKATQAIFVDRGSKTGKEDVIKAMKERVEQPGARQILLFPEGTCTNRESLIFFHRGAFVPGVPIQPVVLRFPHKHFDPTWTAGGPNRTWLLARLCSQFYNNMEVEFMDVIVPTEEEKNDAILFANHVRKKMADTLNIPTSEYSYSDAFFAKLARKLGRDHAALVPYEFTALSKGIEHPITSKEITKAVKQFAKAPPMRNNKGALTPYQFIRKVMNLPVCEVLNQLCSVIDPEGTEVVNFMNYVIARNVMLEILHTETNIDSIMELMIAPSAKSKKKQDHKEDEQLITRQSTVEFIRKFGGSVNATRIGAALFLKIVESDIDKIHADISAKDLNPMTTSIDSIGKRTLGTFLEMYPEYLYVFLSLVLKQDSVPNKVPKLHNVSSKSRKAPEQRGPGDN